MIVMGAEKRQHSRFWTIIGSGMFLLIALASCVAADAGAASREVDSVFFANRNQRGAIRLPGGMDAADVVGKVEMNRESINQQRLNAATSLTPDEPGEPFDIGGNPVYGPAYGTQALSDVSFDGTNYLVVWEDSRQVSPDIFAARVSVSGEILDTVGILIASGTDVDQCFPSVAFGGTNYLVVWQAQPQQVGSSSDIYGTRVATNGDVLDPGGITISAATDDQVNPDVAFNGSDFMVVWQDSRSGEPDIYGARVTTSGNVLNPGGIAISVAPGAQGFPTIAFDHADYMYLVAWTDGRNGSFRDIYGSRVTAGGTVLDPGGINIWTDSYYHRFPAVAASDGSGFLVVWETPSGGSYCGVSGIRVGVTGVLLDSTAIQISATECGHVGVSYGPSVAFDGTNYFVVWSDCRNAFKPEIYGARISTSGSVLDHSGIEISTGGNEECSGVASGNDQYFVVWHDGWSRNTYGARVTSLGNVLDTEGRLISKAASEQQCPAIAFGETDYFVVWRDIREDTASIYGARVSAAGVLLDPEGIKISTGGGWGAPAVASDGANYLVVWGIAGESSPDIYGARVSTSGEVLDTAGIRIATTGWEEREPAVAFDGTHYFVVWQQGMYPYQMDIYGARVTTGGTVIDTTAIPIATASYCQQSPDVAFGNTSYLVVWEDLGGASCDVYGTRVTPEGVVLDPGRIAISQAVGEQGNSRVAFDGVSYFVVWTDTRGGSSCDIYGARVAVSGEVMDTSGIPISTAVYDQAYPALAFDGSDYIVVWQDYRSGSSDIYGSRVETSGIVLDPDGVAISTAPYYQKSPAIGFGLGGDLIAYGSFAMARYGSYRIWGSVWTSPIGVENGGTKPANWHASQSYPNPFNPLCTIRYDLPQAAKVSLKIFDVSGSVVRTLVDAWREPGAYSEVWNGCDDAGKQLSSGVYFYRLEAGDFVATRKMVLLR